MTGEFCSAATIADLACNVQLMEICPPGKYKITFYVRCFVSENKLNSTNLFKQSFYKCPPHNDTTLDIFYVTAGI